MKQSSIKLLWLTIIALLGVIVYLVLNPVSTKNEIPVSEPAPGVAPDGSTFTGPTGPPPSLDTEEFEGDPIKNSTGPTQGPPPTIVPVEETS